MITERRGAATRASLITTKQPAGPEIVTQSAKVTSPQAPAVRQVPEPTSSPAGKINLFRAGLETQIQESEPHMLKGALHTPDFAPLLGTSSSPVGEQGWRQSRERKSPTLWEKYKGYVAGGAAALSLATALTLTVPHFANKPVAEFQTYNTVTGQMQKDDLLRENSVVVVRRGEEIKTSKLIYCPVVIFKGEIEGENKPVVLAMHLYPGETIDGVEMIPDSSDPDEVKTEYFSRKIDLALEYSGLSRVDEIELITYAGNPFESRIVDAISQVKKTEGAEIKRHPQGDSGFQIKINKEGGVEIERGL
ncbi:MAG TPA: hypothetical protein DD648_01520, partial [Candidatus Omnitrophica bacterium]|nr:hypothetical protein [Candidatus Omnitrophota bacterium]